MPCSSQSLLTKMPDPEDQNGSRALGRGYRSNAALAHSYDPNPMYAALASMTFPLRRCNGVSIVELQAAGNRNNINENLFEFKLHFIL